MNVSGIGIGITATQLFDTWTVSMGGSEKKAGSKPEKVSSENNMIEHFKEEHNPVAKKIEAIMAKFKGGQELSPEEMEFLAKNAPDCYQQVIDILMERQQLEMKLKAAESKMEVLQVYTESLAMVKATKGTGAVEKQNASKTMMRLNHLQNAFGEFVKTPQYRDLEDEGDRAEEIREKAEENGQVQEESSAEESSAEESSAEEILAEEISPEGASPEEMLPEGTSTKEASTDDDNPFIRAKVSSSGNDMEFRKKVHDLYNGNMKRKNYKPVSSGITV